MCDKKKIIYICLNIYVSYAQDPGVNQQYIWAKWRCFFKRHESAIMWNEICVENSCGRGRAPVAATACRVDLVTRGFKMVPRSRRQVDLVMSARELYNFYFVVPFRREERKGWRPLRSTEFWN